MRMFPSVVGNISARTNSGGFADMSFILSISLLLKGEAA